MKLKDKLKTHIHQASIPDLKEKIIFSMQNETLEEKKKVTYHISPFLVVKFASMLLLITGISLLFMTNRANQTYAFSRYEDVLMQASQTALALFEDDQNTIEAPLSTLEHVSLIEQELKTMVRYHMIFERLLVSRKPRNIIKTDKDSGFQLHFEYVDLEDNVIPLSLKIEKHIKNLSKDEFLFEGNLDDFEVKGETKWITSTHALDISLKKDAFEINIVYLDDTQTYDIEILKDGIIIQYFTYQITYDNFNRPSISMTYQNEQIKNTFDLSFQTILKQVNMNYEITTSDSVYQGKLSIRFQFMPSPRLMVTLTLDDGQTFDYQFNRPTRPKMNQNTM